MERSLAEHGIGYMHFPDLGGRRVPRRDSQNSLWRNEGFRGYADYMGTPAFQTAIGQLEQLTSARRTAVLCAEALWWQCHRMLIADYLKVSGAEVLHILNSAKAEEHTYTQPARIVEGKLTYIIPQPELQLNLKTEE